MRKELHNCFGLTFDIAQRSVVLQFCEESPFKMKMNTLAQTVKLNYNSSRFHMKCTFECNNTFLNQHLTKHNVSSAIAPFSLNVMRIQIDFLTP